MNENSRKRLFPANGVSISLPKAVVSASMVLLVSFGQSREKAVVPNSGDGKGMFVRLDLPWTTLVKDERIQFDYTLINASGRAAPVAIPDAIPELGVGFGWPAGGQPFIEGHYSAGFNKHDICPLDAPLVIEDSSWPPLDGFGHEMQAWLHLPPGKQIVWNQKHLPDQYFGVWTVLALQGMQAHWLVGPDRWISSNIVPVRVIDVPASERIDAFKAEWIDANDGKSEKTARAQIIPVQGKLFLFVDSCRVTEVSASDSFDYRMNADMTNMEIVISGHSGVLRKYYHVKHGFSRDIPWPVGPVSVFNPEPEPIPADILEALRTRKDSSGDEPSVCSDLAAVDSPHHSNSFERGSASVSRRNHFVRALVGGTMLLAGLTILVHWINRKIGRRAIRKAGS